MTNRSMNLIVGLIIGLCALVIFPAAQAGNLEPSGPPAPTMKTLDQIPPTWSQKLSAAARWETVLNGYGVLDKETGLVWEKSPITTADVWDTAENHCISLTVDNRRGWRLPTIQELSSLLDPSQSNPALPAGHPFSNVQTDVGYWTQNAEIQTTIPSLMWSLSFADLDALAYAQATPLHMWCVRGGKGTDAQ